MGLTPRRKRIGDELDPLFWKFLVELLLLLHTTEKGKLRESSALKQAHNTAIIKKQARETAQTEQRLRKNSLSFGIFETQHRRDLETPLLHRNTFAIRIVQVRVT